MTPNSYREFNDASGVRWKVYRVEPQLVSPALERLRETLTSTQRERRQPWLLFESNYERRRLAPVPGAWDGNCTDAELEGLCSTAEPIPPAPARREEDRRR
jgi:hypothetical protein